MQDIDLQHAESSDSAMLDLLRRGGELRIGQLASGMGVTATAVRQRLNRLMRQGLIERTAVREEDSPAGRGRPCYRYRLTERGQRLAGDNFGDLAAAMWKEIRAVKDVEVRRGLLDRLATTMAAMYQPHVSGETAGERMESVSQLLKGRGIPFSVERSGTLPVLVAEACPYPGLPEQDRSLCAMERMLFSKLVAQDVRLTGCRLDGANCCTFEMS
ncbi:MAG: MarR family transcriptional regulator [Planctomycetes bacterium]|nr:MarR family transcriptional regulator [Planctomycetota bacterium]